jgi:hypothetical protein
MRRIDNKSDTAVAPVSAASRMAGGQDLPGRLRLPCGGVQTPRAEPSFQALHASPWVC